MASSLAGDCATARSGNVADDEATIVPGKILPHVWARFAPMREAYALPGNRGVEPPEIAQRLKGLFR